MALIRFVPFLFAALVCAEGDSSHSQTDPVTSKTSVPGSEEQSSLQSASPGTGSLRGSTATSPAEAVAEATSSAAGASAAGASLAELPAGPANGSGEDPESARVPGDEGGSAPWDHLVGRGFR
eukprot:TRINITY_DN16044_c0_g1_i2.p3 TRINITY_DN16044_c0_g1~~TRINITY_DN16044_c0_g1_i2.p3  ORF type:complete len:123 (+),score=20.37 TRINITY_DN16044_c0_g1_i2:65-433(+)